MPSDDWKTLSDKLAVNGCLSFFESGKNKAAKGEGRAPPSISAQDTVEL